MIDGVAVVGSASEAATIEITSDDNTADSGMNGGDDTELAEGENTESSEEADDGAANPSIDVKPAVAPHIAIEITAYLKWELTHVEIAE